MGEVSRAKDTKLNRDVTIKVLPNRLRPIRIGGPLHARAHVLASLNHPNITALYGIEESGSRRALVMELVEGRDSSEIIGTAAYMSRNRRAGEPSIPARTSGPSAVVLYERLAG